MVRFVSSWSLGGPLPNLRVTLREFVDKRDVNTPCFIYLEPNAPRMIPNWRQRMLAPSVTAHRTRIPSDIGGS